MSELGAVIGAGLPMAEAVPSAVGLAVAVGNDPYAAIVAAANEGADSDTVALIAGAMVAAWSDSLKAPGDMMATLRTRQRHRSRRGRHRAGGRRAALKQQKTGVRESPSAGCRGEAGALRLDGGAALFLLERHGDIGIGPTVARCRSRYRRRGRAG